jgi:hypothetical protein
MSIGTRGAQIVLCGLVFASSGCEGGNKPELYTTSTTSTDPEGTAGTDDPDDTAATPGTGDTGLADADGDGFVEGAPRRGRVHRGRAGQRL